MAKKTKEPTPEEVAAKSLQRVEEVSKQAQMIGEAEIGASAGAMTAQAEVQGALVVAQKFPRDEDEAFGKIMRSCRRSGFADQVEYKFPRGQTQVTGPSIYLMREMAKAWGNITHGFRVVQDDDEMRTIRGYAWDLQSNTRVELEDSFKKLIQRKVKGGDTKWVVPDERDLRELTNRRGAMLVRECIRGLIPQDYIDAAVEEAHKTIQAGIEADPDEARKNIIAGFNQLNVKAAALKKYLGCALEEASPAQLADLRAIYESIRDGHSTWAEYVEKNGDKKKAPAKTGTLDPSKLTPSEDKKKEEGIEYVNADDIESIDNLQQVAAKLGFDITDLNEFLKKTCGTAVLKKIPKADHEAVLDFLTGWIDELSSKPKKVEEAEIVEEPEEEAEEVETVPLLSAAARKRLTDTAGKLGIDPDSVEEHLEGKYGTPNLADVPAQFETSILAWMAKQ
jgi:hypothetical protein